MNYVDTLAFRCCNPANIRYNLSNSWKGLVGSEKGFCKFENDLYGIRALIYLLRTYYLYRDCDTIRSIISRYAPSSENDTDSYISFVSDFVGVESDEELPLSFDKDANTSTRYLLFHICEAICLRESNYHLFFTLFNKAFDAL